MKQSKFSLYALVLVFMAAMMFRTGGMMLLSFSRLLMPLVLLGGGYYFLKRGWHNFINGPTEEAPKPPIKEASGTTILDICAKCGKVKGKECKCRS